MTKFCFSCNIEKYYNEFYKNNHHKDGLATYCKICDKAKTKQYQIKNKNKVNLRQKDYRKNFPERYKKYQKINYKWLSDKIKFDINYKLKSNLRTRINIAIKRNYKSGSAVKDLGCSIEDFKKYIESKFQEGMSWNNYGKWHLDHIYPLSKVNLTDKEQFLKVTHYTNYQPLWAIDNIKKGNKIL